MKLLSSFEHCACRGTPCGLFEMLLLKRQAHHESREHQRMIFRLARACAHQRTTWVIRFARGRGSSWRQETSGVRSFVIIKSTPRRFQHTFYVLKPLVVDYYSAT